MEKKKVMVIDDEVDFLKITKINLEETGSYDVLASSSSKDIVSNVLNFKPDIILLDLLMPGVDGMDILKMLNENPLAKNIPVIILSALSKDADKLKAFKLGVVDYLVKPVEITALVAKIEKALQFK